MTRGPDPALKPALLERIIEFLLDKPLSALTFRALAADLGVSTFTLVYHFGSRPELVRAIIDAIAEVQRDAMPSAIFSDPAAYFAELHTKFEATLQPRSIAIQRLEFEAQMLESLEPDQTITREAHDRWHAQNRIALMALGLTADDADIESGLMIDTFYGIQVALIVNRDMVRARAAMDRAVDAHRSRVEALRDSASA